MEMEFVADVGTLDQELLQLPDVSSFAVISNPYIANELFAQWLSLPDTGRLEAGINGLNSKTHMKIMLKWMRGRKMLKLFCTHIGSSKKFLHSTLPEEPQTVLPDSSTAQVLETAKPSGKRKKLAR